MRNHNTDSLLQTLQKKKKKRNHNTAIGPTLPIPTSLSDIMSEYAPPNFSDLAVEVQTMVGNSFLPYI
jgi:hypothetical protein